MLAHSELFVGTAWCPEAEPHQLRQAVGIRREGSPGYPGALAKNLAGKNPVRLLWLPLKRAATRLLGRYFLVCLTTTLHGRFREVYTEYRAGESAPCCNGCC